MTTTQARSHRVAAARGDTPLDLLIENTHLVNVYTREIYPADIGIVDGYIVFTGPGTWTGPAPETCVAAHGKFAVPGLIDAHMHIESSMMRPANFAAAVLPHGTTTIVADPHEIGNVMGMRGVSYILESTADLPLRVYVQAPSCVPAVPGLETSGAEFGAAEMVEMLTWDRVIGVAEVMDYIGVIQQEPRMREILEAAHAKHTVISGHCPGVCGRDLAAYMVGGPRSDHEAHGTSEILEKLRAGLTIEAVVSSFTENMSDIGNILHQLKTVPPNLVFCTDDVFPGDLLHQGHLDHVVRCAIAAGIPPIDAVRAATLHTAERHRLYDLGALAPGKHADILLLDNLEDFIVDTVFVNGQQVAQKGHLCTSLSTPTLDVEKENTVLLDAPIHDQDFLLHVADARQKVSVRVLTIQGGRRGLETHTFPVTQNVVDITAADNVCLISVIERHGRNGNRSLGLMKGLGLKRGAVATTVAHDSHNLVVIGRNAKDMAIAANVLADCGGGLCAIDAGQVTALLPLPIAGLLSQQPLENLVPTIEKLSAALHDLGIPFERPIGPILSFALPVIPAYSMTDMGLVDVDKQVVLTIWDNED